MTQERVNPEAMLEAALAQLEAAEAWQRVVTAAFERHQELGSPIGLMQHLADARQAALGDAELLGELDRMTLETAPRLASALLHFASWLGGRSPRRPGSDLRAALDRAAPPGTVSLPPSALRVALDETEADDLAATLAALAVPDATRELRALPYRRWVLVRVLGTASGERMGHLGRNVVTDGLVGAAGGMLVLPLDRGRPEVAECWLPLAPEPVPEPEPGPLPGPRVAWAAPDPSIRALLSRLARRARCNLDLYPTNAALLAADAREPHDAAVLALHDETVPAAEARAFLLERGPRTVALVGACDHEGGPLGAHGANPDDFDRHFRYPLNAAALVGWPSGPGAGLEEPGDATA